MEREHLIIIALILVALYMMNNDKKQDKVKAISPIGPMGRIRYTEPDPTNCDPQGPQCSNPCAPCDKEEEKEDFAMPERIRYSDKNFAQSQHIKNHIRSRNTNSMFSGMTTGCGSNHIETFRFENVCDGPNPPPC